MHTTEELMSVIALKGTAIKRGLFGAFVCRLFQMAFIGGAIWEGLHEGMLIRVALWCVMALITAVIARNVLPTELDIREFNNLVDELRKSAPPIRKIGSGEGE